MRMTARCQDASGRGRLTSTTTLDDYFAFRDRNSFFGNVSAHRLGIAAPWSCRSPSPSGAWWAVIGDGSAMYSITALWTALTRRRRDFVIANTRATRSSKPPELFHGNDRRSALDFNDPPMDISTSQNLRRVGRGVDPAAGFDAASTSLARTNGPTLLEVMILS